MKRLTLIIMFTLSFISINSHAALYKNCEPFLDKSGYIKSIAIGVDNGEDSNISLILQVNNIESTPISVYRKVNDENGKAIFDLLISSYVKENAITIKRCLSNQIAGITSTIRY